jgi:hypothetical protein
MVSDAMKVAERNVYDNVAKSLYKEYSPKFPSIQVSEYRDYVSYFSIKSVQGFKQSLGIEKSDRGFSKMRMMERLEQAKAQFPQRLGESLQGMRERKEAGAPERAKVRARVAEEVSHKGILAMIPARKELTPGQLADINRAIRSEEIAEKKASAKKKEIAEK